MLEVVTDYQRLLDLRDEWNDLAARMETPFGRHECAVACVKAFCENRQFIIFVLRSGGKVSAVAPFRITRHGGVERLEAFGRLIQEPTRLLHADEAALNGILDAILNEKRPLMLGRLPSKSREMQLLAQKLGQRRLYGSKIRHDSSIWVRLPQQQEMIEKSMSSGRRSYVRRKMRKAERIGPVALEVHAPDAASVDGLLHTAYQIEALSWKGRNGTAISMSPQLERYMTGYCRSLAAQDMLRLFFLRIGDDRAAMRIAAEHAGRLWELKIGYSERFHGCSPGILLTHLTLQHCCEQKLDAFEFLGQAEDWELAWTDNVRHYEDYTVHPSSISGALARAQDASWQVAKKALRLVGMDTAARKERARRASAAAASASRPLRPSSTPDFD